jgi:hypothetical protein
MFRRRPTDQELDLILRPAAPLGWGDSLFLAIAVFICVFLVVLLAVSFIEGPPPWTVPVSVGSGVVAGATAFVLGQWRARRQAARRAAARAREAAAEVEVTRFEVQDAIAVEEFEDEGLHFYLLLDDGRTLFLSGQYLYDPAEQGFPWRAFEIVRVPGEFWVLSVTRQGDALPPSRTRRPFTKEEWERDAVPLDGTVASLDWAALKDAAA